MKPSIRQAFRDARAMLEKDPSLWKKGGDVAYDKKGEMVAIQDPSAVQF